MNKLYKIAVFTALRRGQCVYIVECIRLGRHGDKFHMPQRVMCVFGVVDNDGSDVPYNKTIGAEGGGATCIT